MFLQQLISLLIGHDWHIFSPGLEPDESEYLKKISMKHVQWFGDYPISYEKIANLDALHGMVEILERMPRRNQTPFATVAEKDIKKEDKEFILKIMKMDPSERPTAEQLLKDKWFEEE